MQVCQTKDKQEFESIPFCNTYLYKPHANWDIEISNICHAVVPGTELLGVYLKVRYICLGYRNKIRKCYFHVLANYFTQMCYITQ